MPTHICGQCSQQFTSDDAYSAHVCQVTGLTPLDPEHLGPEFVAIQSAALARGEERRMQQVNTLLSAVNNARKNIK